MMAPMARPAIQDLRGTHVTWVNVTKTSREELAALKRRFRFHDIDLRECLPPLQRPKLIERPSYLFMILLFPVFNRATREIRLAEIDFFIGKNFVVTVHEDELPVLSDTFKKLHADRAFRAALLDEDQARLLYELLDRLLDGCFPMLTHILNDIDDIEARMTEVRNRETIHEIFRIKTNLVNFKKAVQPHKMVIRKLIGAAPTFFPTEKLLAYFQNLVDHTNEIWDDLESHSDTLDAIEDTHISLLNFRASDTMRVLTIFAVIVFPLTLIATIFGMNTKNTPIVGNPLDFWIIVSLMTAGTLGMLTYFKWKRWL